MKGDAIDDADKEQGPMRAAFSLFDIMTVVDGQEDVGRAGEVWESFLESYRIRGSHEHEGH